MAVNEMGLSTLGITFGYAVGSTKPASFTQLNRISSIGEFSITNETIDMNLFYIFVFFIQFICKLGISTTYNRYFPVNR